MTTQVCSSLRLLYTNSLLQCYVFVKNFSVLVNSRISLLIIFFLFPPLFFFGQCKNPNPAYESGEKLSFEAYYNLGFIWLNAGLAEFSVSETKYNGIPVYKLETSGRSHDGYDWILKVRDYLVTYVDKETLLPYVYRRDTQEGNYKADNTFSFDYVKNEVNVKTYNSDDGYNDTILKLQTCLYDLVSAVYHVRTMDLKGLEEEKVYPIPAIVDGEAHELYIRYKGKENVVVEGSKQEYRCLKFKVKLIEGTIFNEGENMIVWVSDDLNRLPVKVEAKILVGTVKAYLSGYEGIRNPLLSKIE